LCVSLRTFCGAFSGPFSFTVCGNTPRRLVKQTSNKESIMLYDEDHVRPCLFTPKLVRFHIEDTTAAATRRRRSFHWDIRHTIGVFLLLVMVGYFIAALSGVSANVGAEEVVIDGKRYSLDTVRTALLGLAAD